VWHGSGENGSVRPLALAIALLDRRLLCPAIAPATKRSPEVPSTGDPVAALATASGGE